MTKKKVVVVGNCQARPIATLLEKMSDEVEVTKVAIVHLLKSEQEDEYKPFFEEADYIIAQLVNDNYPCEFVRTDILKKLYGSKVKSIVNLYSSEQTTYLSNLPKININIEGPMGIYHFPFVYKCWKDGENVETAINVLSNQYSGQKDLLFNAEYQELKEKEKNSDIKITDYIEEKKCRLFHTFNHPKNALIIEYVGRILKILKFTTNDIPTPEVEFLDQIVPFINDSHYHKTNGGRNSENELISTQDLVSSFY